MGVAGVAWATFICQGIAAILATVTLLIRFSKMQKEIVFPYFSLDMLHKIGSIAIPSILQNSFVSVGNLFIQRLINSYGAIVMAAYSSVIKLNTFVLVSISTFANGLSSFTAQNMGAGKIERIKQGYKDTVKIGMIVAILIGLFFFSCSDFLIGLFLSDSKEVKDVLVEGRVFIRILAIFYIVVSVKLITDGVLKGAGAMKQFMIATFSDLLLRVALSYLFARGFALGTLGIWLSWPVGWIIGAILSFYYYKKDTWCKQNLIS